MAHCGCRLAVVASHGVVRLGRLAAAARAGRSPHRGRQTEAEAVAAGGLKLAVCEPRRWHTRHGSEPRRGSAAGRAAEACGVALPRRRCRVACSQEIGAALVAEVVREIVRCAGELLAHKACRKVAPAFLPTAVVDVARRARLASGAAVPHASRCLLLAAACRLARPPGLPVRRQCR